MKIVSRRFKETQVLTPEQAAVAHQKIKNKHTMSMTRFI